MKQWMQTLALVGLLGWALGGVSSALAQGIQQQGQATGATNSTERPVSVDTTPQYPTGPGSRRDLCGSPDIRAGNLTVGNQQPSNGFPIPNLWFVYDSSGNVAGVHQCRPR